MSLPTILIDQQEKRPWEFPEYDTRQVHLTDADYTLHGYADVFGVERKGLEDLARCCGADRERFRDQIETDSDSLQEYSLIVDSPRSEVRRGDYYSNIHPNSILGTADAWSERYDFDWYFEGNRYQAAKRAVRLLRKWYAKYG